MAQQNQSTAVAVTSQGVQDFLAKHAGELVPFAKRKYDQVAWLQTAVLCILESAQLMEACATEAGKRSLFHALRYAATTGLSLNPQEGKACLVPRQGKIAYWIMSRGWVELLTENPRVDRVHGFAVYTGDEFDLTQTLDGDKYTFRPALDDRGTLRGFVSAIRYYPPGGASGPAMTSVHYMSLKQMEEHRAKYETFKSADSAWAKSFEGRAIAACVKQHVRRLALGESIVDAALNADDTEGDDEPRDVTPGTTAEELERRVTETVGEKPAAVTMAEGKGSPTPKPDGGLF